MEELEKREREEAMRDVDQVTDDNEHQNYLDEQYRQVRQQTDSPTLQFCSSVTV